MRIISLTTIWTILFDIIAWFIIHLGVSYLIYLIPVQYFNQTVWLFRTRKWEKEGRIYKTIFRIKNWKHLLPDGSIFFQKGFQKSRLLNFNKGYLNTFLKETCRAELTHWIVILFAPIFFLWNYFFVGLIMIVYALIVNFPCIITQRFNRIRLNKALKRFFV